MCAVGYARKWRTRPQYICYNKGVSEAQEAQGDELYAQYGNPLPKNLIEVNERNFWGRHYAFKENYLDGQEVNLKQTATAMLQTGRYYYVSRFQGRTVPRYLTRTPASCSGLLSPHR